MNSSIPDGSLQLRLLGPPQIIWQSKPFPLRRRQARALLFHLAHMDEPVPRERLAFLFWPDLPDSTARNNLKRLLSTLRRALPDSSLLSGGRGTVAVDMERIGCDSATFQRLAASGEPATLAQAVDLYQGAFLDGFHLPNCPEYGDWQFQTQQQQERLYLATLSGLIDVQRAAGDIESANDYAHRYLAVDDLAEDVHRRLIELYASRGDRTAAARQFEQCTLILERELGVKPLPETREAYEAAISARPVPAPVSPTWTVLPSLDLPLIGREEACLALADAHRRLQAGGLILISGEPGIGKSRLMQDFAITSGLNVLTGNNPVGAQAIPYTAISEALRQALSFPERWQGIRPIWLAEVGRLLPEMNDVFPNLPRPVDVEPAQAQARLFEALTRCFVGLAAYSPLLICLDDLHWADPAMMGWLAALQRRLTGSNICILATYRIAQAEALDDLKRAYSRPGLLAEVQLSRLTPAAVSGILEQLPQALADTVPLAERIHHATGGNTFFVLETVRALLESDSLADPPDQLPLAPTVQAAIQRRLDNLSPLGRQVLETTAVLSPDLAFALIQRAAGRSEMEVAEGLDEVVGRQLLVGEGEHRFGHDLVRQVTYDEISSWRRAILHRRAAEALQETGLHGEELAWATMASHYNQAGDSTQAIRSYEQAALTAQRLYAHQEATTYLQRAIKLRSTDRSEPGHFARLHELLGNSLLALGRLEAANDAFSTALERTPLDASSQRAILYRKQAEAQMGQRHMKDADESFTLALEAMGMIADDWSQERLRTWLDIQLPRMDFFYFSADLDRLTDLAEQIKPVLEAAGTPAHHVNYDTGLMQIAMTREHYSFSIETVALARSMFANALEKGDLAGIAYSQFGLGFTLLWAGMLKQAATPLLASLKLAEEAGIAHIQVLCLTYLTILCRLLDDVAQARHYAERSLTLTEQVDMPPYYATALANRAWLAWRDGLPEQALADAEQTPAIWGDYPYPFRWLAWWVLLAIHTERDELSDAVEAARAILHPIQRRQPGDLPEVLERAIQTWEDGDQTASQTALQQAIESAKAEGYL